MLIGHQKQWRFLEKSAEQGRLSHAYLFTGQEKLGKKTLALEFIKSSFGNPPLLESHPDFLFIEPAKNEIQINQVKNLNWRLSQTTFSAPFKAAIIDQAHLMNIETQNCFLKTLEEPRGETLLILITEHPEFLFPTIRSRCEIIKFFPVPKKEIENYLKEQGVEEKMVRIISQISQGRPGMVIDFLNSPQKLKEREKLRKEIIKLTKSDLTSRFQYVKKISQSADLKEILKIWLTYFREILISDLISQSNPTRLKKISAILKKIQDTYFLISTTNVNPRLAMEILMLEL